ncbi:MAG TPA: hypothetical protein DCR32_05650 [Opitutae bacterium]|nr:hypothetical protein [Opitutae bacterium]
MPLNWDRCVSIGRLVVGYIVGQGATQVLQLVTGFLIINWLTKDAYATFALVIAIQSTTSVLVELGLSQSLIAFIGQKYQDSKIVGRYITACRYLRDRMLFVGGVVLLVFFYCIAPKYEWSGGVWFVLWFSVIGALVFQSWSATYNPLLLLDKNLKVLYAIGLSSGVLRVGLIAVAYFWGVLSAPLVLLYGALQACVAGWGAREQTRSMICEPADDLSLRTERKEILSQVLPRVPSSIFFAFEGQITIFLISIFGTTNGIAELGALGRLAMLFVIIRKANSILVAPYFSKLASCEVFSKAALFVCGSLLFALASSAFVYCLPEPFLWVLGDGYQHLKFELFLVMAVSALNLVSMLMFSICLSRKYIFPWYSIVDIGPVCLAMVIGYMLMDLGTLSGVLYFSMMLALVKLLSVFFVLGYGLRREQVSAVDCGAAT